MPYKLKSTGGGWKVAKKHGGKTFSKKPMSKAKAKRQMAAIHANESFEGRLDLALFEGKPPGGYKGEFDDYLEDQLVEPEEDTSKPSPRSNTVKGTLPTILDREQREAIYEYDAFKAEPQTYDYPGSPAHIDLCAVCVQDRELDLDRLYKEHQEIYNDELEWAIDQAENPEIYKAPDYDELDELDERERAVDLDTYEP